MSSEDSRPTHGFNVSQSPPIASPAEDSSSDSRQALISNPATNVSSPAATSGSKPKLKVVEIGQEHTGRWTREEHESFLLALQNHGKEWKKVAAKVKTRTVVQTRTHAQKYFQKLQKGLVSNEIDGLEIGTADEAKKILPIASARRGQEPVSGEFVKKVRKKQDRSLLATAMSAQKRHAAAATQAAAQLMTQISQINTTNEDQSMLNAAAIAGVDQQMYSAQRFSQGAPPASTGMFSAGTSFAAPTGLPSSQMKIIAPQPEHTMKKNKFPEPSPAACGKRKVAELAVAQMLAGVAASGKLLSPSLPRKIARASTPSPDVNGHDHVASVGSARASGSLQIINPETLKSSESTKKRNLGQEPVTPWDGQLEALNSEVKNKVEEPSDLDSGALDECDEREALLQICKGAEQSTLHAIVCTGSLEEVEKQLEIMQADSGDGPEWEESLRSSLQSFDQLGFNPLHAAAVLPGGEGGDAYNMSRLLISVGAVVTSIDSFGNTPLHWAARVGNVRVMELLVLENCPLDVRNEMGEMALHWAMRSGQRGLLAIQFLLENGANSSLFSKSFQRPLDVAGNGFDELCEGTFPIARSGVSLETDKVSAKELLEVKRQSREKLFSLSPQARTLILHHPECLEHLPKQDTDWEAPDRVNAIMSTLLETSNKYIRDYEIQVTTHFDRASLEFLSRVHSAEYLTFVNNLSKELEKRHLAEQAAEKKKVPSIVPFTPMVQRSVMRELTVKKGTHSDTSFSSGSLRAARRAAGAVKHAVDCVLVGRNRNAFCITRPPGHHAGINGLLDGGESCGFCLFNNVAAGAMHALSDENHRPKCERCAIVDIDVHHGNGTEEIVKRCDHPGRLFFFSVHLYDNDKKKGKPNNGFKFYPGTGDEDDVAHNVINVPIAPMWKNTQPRSRSQSPVPENRHNTRHKTKQKAAVSSTGNGSLEDNEPNDNEPNDEVLSAPPSTEESKVDASQPESPSRQSKQQAQPSFLYGTGREAYRRSIQQRLLPSLRAFNPDLILLSIGFDASKGDVGNARHYRNGRQQQGIDLEPEDYAWTTRKIMEVADICCQGRVVSILEGGYGRPRGDNSEGGLLDKTMISECAMGHIQALIDPHDVEKRRSK